MLWQVRMRIGQKFGIGTFLCLSICMVVIASIRLSRLWDDGATTSGWQYFWLEIEACVAVLTVSLTAVRSIFVDNPNSGARQPRQWYSSAVARNVARKQHGARREPQGPSDEYLLDRTSSDQKNWLVTKVHGEEASSEMGSSQRSNV